jgi:dephospho-CoA kinase
MFKKILNKHKVDATFFDVDDIRRKILVEENIDRDLLNQRIYSSGEEMKKYKQFINPKIKEYLVQQIKKTNGFIFIEWALLVEDSLDDIVDSIIMVYCEKETQIKRFYLQRLRARLPKMRECFLRRFVRLKRWHGLKWSILMSMREKCLTKI